MPALIVHNAGMKSRHKQYTIRNIPRLLDRHLRQRTRQIGHSLNRVVLDALQRGAGFIPPMPVHHDLDRLAGTWVEDRKFDAAIAAQDRIDPALWS